MDRLEGQAVERKLAEHPEWSLNGDMLQRTFRFGDFMEAMGFVIRVAELAQELEHHPDIMIRSNKVTLTVGSPDAGGLTDQDFTIARATDDLTAAREG